MSDFNKVIIMGRLTKQPELRSAGSTSVTDLSVATSEKFKDKSGELQEKTCFIDAVVWGVQAENCCKYLIKGQQVLVEGSLQLERWEKDGQKRSMHKIKAQNVQFLAKPKGSESTGEAPEKIGSFEVIPEKTEEPDDVPF